MKRVGKTKVWMSADDLKKLISGNRSILNMNFSHTSPNENYFLKPVLVEIEAYSDEAVS